MKRKRMFIAVRFPHGKLCTCGEPNKRTGRYSIALEFKIFFSEYDRKRWINGVTYQGDSLGCRVKMNIKTLRKYCRGMSLEQFQQMIDFELWDMEVNLWNLNKKES